MENIEREYFIDIKYRKYTLALVSDEEYERRYESRTDRINGFNDLMSAKKEVNKMAKDIIKDIKKKWSKKADIQVTDSKLGKTICDYSDWMDEWVIEWVFDIGFKKINK